MIPTTVLTVRAEADQAVSTLDVVPRPSREQVLAEIRGTALRMFVEHGYETTTLAQVADAVGYSKSALLYHFASKDALLEQALLEPLHRLDAYLDQATGASREQQLAGLVDLVLAHRHEAALLKTPGRLTASSGPVLVAADRLMEMFLGPEPDVERSVAVHVALAGLTETAAALPDVPADILRAPLLAAAARALDLSV